MDGEATTLDSLLEEISFRRRKDLRNPPSEASNSVASTHSTTFWTDLFVRHFLFQTDYEVDRDDLLFFIRKNLNSTMAALVNTHLRNESFAVEVFRRDSRKLPIGDPDIDWEETIYLNLIIHLLNYQITLAVCSRTSPKNLQVLKRYSHKVYATPSRRKMESKGDYEEMTYPHISFNVDNFEDMFKEVVLRDGESVGIELTASDPNNKFSVVLFSASVPYEAVRRVYEARTSQTVRKRLSQTNLFSLFSGKYGESRVEYVRLVGPQGYAELAVSRVKEAYGSSGNYGGCDTPSSEPATDIFDQMLDSDSETEEPLINPVIGFKKGHQRRSSDPSSTLNDFMRLGMLDRPGKSRALTDSSDNLDSMGDATCEIYAGDLLDEFEETKYNPLWTMKGYTQIFHSWRESKRLQSIPLGQYVTFVTLPWWSIVKEVLEKKSHPLLTF